MTTTLYVVMGYRSEYDVHEEWLVAAYADESKATLHAARAQAKQAEVEASRSGPLLGNYGHHEHPLDTVVGFSECPRDNRKYSVYSVAVLVKVPTSESGE